jgi:maltose alpha-D-glucosyltransferase/alpha-amylase
MFMGIQQEDRHPITEILRQTPDIPENCQWAMFLRNHDELTLEMVTDEERDYMYQAYAAEPQMRINVGIRRRLAPLLENSRRRIELMTALLFSMPGTPVIYYGDEIGMGDNIYLGDRNGVRTPMQWTGDRNGGFSRADPARLYAPPIMDPVYGYEALNVEAQERSPFSLLHWMKRIIGLRKETTVFGRGSIEFLPARNRKILAYVRRHGEDIVLCVANLARTVQPVELDLARFKGMTPVEMVGLTEFPKIGDLPYFLTLGPYAFYMFKVQQSPVALTARVAPETATDVTEVPGLLVGAAWETVLDGNVRTLIERDLLLPFLHRQRWFGGKSRPSRKARFVDWGVLRRGLQPLFVTIVEVEFDDGGREQYFLPLTIRPTSDVMGLADQSPHAVLANVTGARKGVLFDAWLDGTYARTLLNMVERQEQMATKRGTIRAAQSRLFPQLRDQVPPDATVSQMGVEQSNTSIVYADRLILKLFRRMQAGLNPDLELSLHLSERATFTRVPAVAGWFEYLVPGNPLGTLAMMQQFVTSQGDGWTHALGAVGRFYDEIGDATAPHLPPAGGGAALEPSEHMTGAMGGYLDTAATLGRRTAEMHLALASGTNDAAFSAEPLGRADLDRVTAGSTAQAQHALQTLKSMRGTLSDDVRQPAEELLQCWETLLERIRCAPPLEFVASKIRVHGDYHLGQVLWSEGDFYILDFEGEPARPLEERRLKQSPLKDVAGMLRSFGYAAYAGLFAFVSSRRSEYARLEAWARVWQLSVSAAFLGTYFDLVADSLFLPPVEEDRDALLRLFVLEKALYELNYELNNRPDWARIPLRGILDLLNAPLTTHNS